MTTSRSPSASTPTDAASNATSAPQAVQRALNGDPAGDRTPVLGSPAGPKPSRPATPSRVVVETEAWQALTPKLAAYRDRLEADRRRPGLMPAALAATVLVVAVVVAATTMADGSTGATALATAAIVLACGGAIALISRQVNRRLDRETERREHAAEIRGWVTRTGELTEQAHALLRGPAANAAAGRSAEG